MKRIGGIKVSLRERGSVLILVLILLMILFVMGMTLLSIRSTQATGVAMMKYGMVAKYIAEAGMEDARVKFTKDLKFPPGGSQGDYFFSYTESLKYTGDRVLGEYTVTIDTSRNVPGTPNYDRSVLVTSVGISRDPNGNIMARHKISALLDASLQKRGGSGENPNLYQYIDWQDQGSL